MGGMCVPIVMHPDFNMGAGRERLLRGYPCRRKLATTLLMHSHSYCRMVEKQSLTLHSTEKRFNLIN